MRDRETGRSRGVSRASCSARASDVPNLAQFGFATYANNVLRRFLPHTKFPFVPRLTRYVALVAGRCRECDRKYERCGV